MQDTFVGFYALPLDFAAINALSKVTGVNRSMAVRFLIREGVKACASKTVNELMENILASESMAVAKQLKANGQVNCIYKTE